MAFNIFLEHYAPYGASPILQFVIFIDAYVASP